MIRRTRAAAVLLTVVSSMTLSCAAGDGSSISAGDEPGVAVVEEPSLAAGREVVAQQLFRSNDRARITAVAADREPFALGQTVRLAVEVEMLSGMHVNANPPTFDWMIPIEASVEGVEGVSAVEPFYPEPVSVKFPYDDDPYLVYEGTFVLGLVVAIAEDIPAGGRELEIVLDYQACNEEACFAPAETSIKMPIMIVADAAQSGKVSSSLIDRAPFPRN